MPAELLALSIRFERNGFLYWQVCRCQKAAIYEQRMPDNVQHIFFEVWAIRASPERIFNGTLFPAKERAPANEDWGKYGWTFYTLQEARKKYEQLIKN